ncbi:hypothetical protein TSUD_154320 [Trifolium subterraneum]|uniref:Uncharacterized protein n=1 Tax=Trifolium subterraneum TaxID=3900 RepID=A0A2Z6P5B2_TRISU|nr:hypothetical protein TSUD_154320 [Trifolium subterraneum]
MAGNLMTTNLSSTTIVVLANVAVRFSILVGLEIELRLDALNQICDLVIRGKRKKTGTEGNLRESIGKENEKKE